MYVGVYNLVPYWMPLLWKAPVTGWVVLLPQGGAFEGIGRLFWSFSIWTDILRIHTLVNVLWSGIGADVAFES